MHTDAEGYRLSTAPIGWPFGMQRPSVAAMQLDLTEDSSTGRVYDYKFKGYKEPLAVSQSEVSPF